jgi:hypothetical protein
MQVQTYPLFSAYSLRYSSHPLYESSVLPAPAVNIQGAAFESGSVKNPYRVESRGRSPKDVGRRANDGLMPENE